MSTKPQPGPPVIDRRFAIEFAVAAFCAVGAYLCRNHIFGLDTGGTLYLRFLILAILVTLWLLFRLIFRIRE